MEDYPDYLRDVARHKIVLQLDRSHVPGQVQETRCSAESPAWVVMAQSNELRFPKRAA
jgi:hypothetical protein